MSKTQKRALNKMEIGKEYSAYQLRESLATLHSLVRLGLLSKRAELGSVWSPRTGLLFTKNRE